MLSSLAPDGYFERELAERIALLLWRLRRVARAEREAIALAQETVEDDLVERQRYRSDALPRSDEARARVQNARADLQLLERLPSMADDTPLHWEQVDAVLNAVALAVQDEDFDLYALPLPGLPPDTAIDEYPNWTASLVRLGIAAIATHDRQTTESLLAASIVQARRRVSEAEVEAKRVTTAIDRLRRERLVPNAATLTTLLRNETSLERSLYRALHELERVQAARAGVPVVPPMALDVDVAVIGGPADRGDNGFVSQNDEMAEGLSAPESPLAGRQKLGRAGYRAGLNAAGATIAKHDRDGSLSQMRMI